MNGRPPPAPYLRLRSCFCLCCASRPRMTTRLLISDMFCWALCPVVLLSSSWHPVLQKARPGKTGQGKVWPRIHSICKEGHDIDSVYV